MTAELTEEQIENLVDEFYETQLALVQFVRADQERKAALAEIEQLLSQQAELHEKLQDTEKEAGALSEKINDINARIYATPEYIVLQNKIIDLCRRIDATGFKWLYAGQFTEKKQKEQDDSST